MPTKEEIAVVDADLTSAKIAEMFKEGTIDQLVDFVSTKDPAEVSRDIAEQRDKAKNWQGLLGSDAVSGKNFTNKPFRPTRLQWQPGKVEGDGLPFYAVIHAQTPPDANGEVKEVVITCGAKNVVNIFAIADREGLINESAPYMKFVPVPLFDKATGKPTGFSALDLKPCPELDRF